MRLTRAQAVAITAIVLNAPVDANFNIIHEGSGPEVVCEVYMPGGERPNWRYHCPPQGGYALEES